MGLPDSICPLPWQNLSVDVDGSSRPCCKFAHHDPDSTYQIANLKDAPLDDVWAGAGMQKLRADFLAGVRPLECRTCWDEEASGVPSFRQVWASDRLVHGDADYSTLTPDHPAALDLKLSNACNLKCRICAPMASSTWLREELEVAGDDVNPELLENRRYFTTDKITRDDRNLEVFRAWLPHLEHLELTGGEPMMSPENRRVVDLLVAEGRPEQVNLLVTTNATVIDERIVGHFDRFGRVTLSLSIDDIGPRLEYERSPSDWAEVEANIRRYAQMASSTCRVNVNCSIGVLNVWYLPEFIDWLTGDSRLAPIGVNLNLVHNDRHYNIQCLPTAVKAEVRARLAPLTVDGRLEPHVRAQVAEVADFMDARPAEDEVWAEFLRVTEERDRIRHEQFAAVFPDLHRALVHSGDWPEGERLSLRRRGGRLLRARRA